jgi:hypothetical protein
MSLEIQVRKLELILTPPPPAPRVFDGHRGMRLDRGAFNEAVRILTAAGILAPETPEELADTMQALTAAGILSPETNDKLFHQGGDER